MEHVKLSHSRSNFSLMTDQLAITPRKIIHVDMDAFFASVEQRDNPELRGKPIVVGGSRERGVVAAASYEARKFGIHSAMPSVTARRRCSELIFVKPRFDVYHSVSHQIREIFYRYTDLVEPMSLDEAYLDVTTNKMNMPTATEIAKDIRSAIKNEISLTASAGVSYNKFLAKMASDQRKPDGLFVIKPNQGERFIEALQISKFHGIGKAGTEKMKRLGIETGFHLKSVSREFLISHFGKAGSYFYDLARGVDNRPVCPDRVRKSLGKEVTFDVDSDECDYILGVIKTLSEAVWSTTCDRGIHARTVTLKIKFHDFEQITRSKTSPVSLSSKANLEHICAALVTQLFPLPKKIRLIGLTLSGFEIENPGSNAQLSLHF